MTSVIYLPQFDEIITFHPMGMDIRTRRGFDFPLKEYNDGTLIQIVLGEL